MTQSCPLHVAKPDPAQVKALEFKPLLVRGQGVGPGVGVGGMPRNNSSWQVTVHFHDEGNPGPEADHLPLWVTLAAASASEGRVPPAGLLYAPSPQRTPGALWDRRLTALASSLSPSPLSPSRLAACRP